MTTPVKSKAKRKRIKKTPIPPNRVIGGKGRIKLECKDNECPILYINGQKVILDNVISIETIQKVGELLTVKMEFYVDEISINSKNASIEKI